MKRSDLHQVIGCLFSEGKIAIARKLAVMSGETEYKKYFLGKIKEFGVKPTELYKLTSEQWDEIDEGWTSQKEERYDTKDTKDVGEQ